MPFILEPNWWTLTHAQCCVMLIYLCADIHATDEHTCETMQDRKHVPSLTCLQHEYTLTLLLTIYSCVVMAGLA